MDYGKAAFNKVNELEARLEQLALDMRTSYAPQKTVCAEFSVRRYVGVQPIELPSFYLSALRSTSFSARVSLALDGRLAASGGNVRLECSVGGVSLGSATSAVNNAKCVASFAFNCPFIASNAGGRGTEIAFSAEFDEADHFIDSMTVSIVGANIAEANEPSKLCDFVSPEFGQMFAVERGENVGLISQSYSDPNLSPSFATLPRGSDFAATLVSGLSLSQAATGDISTEKMIFFRLDGSTLRASAVSLPSATAGESVTVDSGVSGNVWCCRFSASNPSQSGVLATYVKQGEARTALIKIDPHSGALAVGCRAVVRFSGRVSKVRCFSASGETGACVIARVGNAHYYRLVSDANPGGGSEGGALVLSGGAVKLFSGADDVRARAENGGMAFYTSHNNALKRRFAATTANGEVSAADETVVLPGGAVGVLGEESCLGFADEFIPCEDYDVVRNNNRMKLTRRV